MTYTAIFLLLTLFMTQPGYALPLFTDNFESGDLNNWTVGGRQQGTNVANVVDCGAGNDCAHLYHAGFSEISLARAFAFDAADMGTFYFDLKVSVASQSPPGWNYYGMAGVQFIFSSDANSPTLAWVGYVASTTDYIFSDTYANLNLPMQVSVNRIENNVSNHYEISVADMLSQISIDQGLIKTVTMQLITYSSTAPYPSVSAELWIDNVSTVPPISAVPEPMSMLLFGTGLAGIGGYVRRKLK
jgi:hypothetical protein